MELKKNVKYDLESKSPLFFFIGLIVALLCVTAAFEWRMEYDPVDLPESKDYFDPPMDIVITRIPEPEPPKPIEKKAAAKPIHAVTVVETTEEIQPMIEEPIIDFNFDNLPVDVPPTEPAPAVHDVVEAMPSFPGGTEAFYRYISEHINYPKQAKKKGITGRVYVQFVIDENGKITDVTAIKGVGAGLDEEAVRVLENAPGWIPGKQRGRPVKVRMVVPITFRLNY